MMPARPLRMLLACALLTGPAWADGADEETPHVVLAPAYAEVVDLRLGFAHILKLQEAAATIAVGNSGVVEAGLSDDQTLVLTAQAPGTTNLIALDATGNQILNTMVRVVVSGTLLTTVYRGSQRQTYSCADRCTPVVSIGDDPEFFGNGASQLQTHQSLAGEGQ